MVVENICQFVLDSPNQSATLGLSDPDSIYADWYITTITRNLSQWSRVQSCSASLTYPSWHVQLVRCTCAVRSSCSKWWKRWWRCQRLQSTYQKGIINTYHRLILFGRMLTNSWTSRLDSVHSEKIGKSRRQVETIWLWYWWHCLLFPAWIEMEGKVHGEYASEGCLLTV